MSEITKPMAEEPPLRPGFAARVLREAGAVRRRRRRNLVLAAGGAAVLLIGAGTGWRLSMVPEAGPAVPEANADPDAQLASTDAQGERTDALSYMFPDAASVAAFQQQFATEDEGDGVENAVAVPGSTSDDDLAL